MNLQFTGVTRRSIATSTKCRQTKFMIKFSNAHKYICFAEFLFV